MKNRKRVWVPLLVLLLVAAIWYSRPVTLPDLMKGQELQEINVLIRSLGDWAQEPETATVSVPLTSPEGAALLKQLQDLSFCRSLTDPLIKPLAQAVNCLLYTSPSPRDVYKRQGPSSMRRETGCSPSPSPVQMAILLC